MDFEDNIKEECNCTCGDECQHDHCQCGHCNCVKEDDTVQNKRDYYLDLPRMVWDADDFADWD